jgi:hypothetical protein
MVERCLIAGVDSVQRDVDCDGLAAPALGVIADHTSLRTAIALLTLMPAICTLAGLRMHAPGPGGRNTPVPDHRGHPPDGLAASTDAWLPRPGPGV